MNTLVDYFEEYLKQEGLSSTIPAFRKKSIFQSPPKLIATIWIGGLWFIAILMTWGFGSVWSTITFLLISFVVLLFVVFLLLVVVQRKRPNRPISPLLIGGIIVIIYPLVILGFIFERTVGWLGYWQETTISFILILLLMLFVIVFNSTPVFVLGLHSFQTLLKLVGKSVTALLVIAPLLLIVVILSIFQQDLWVILGNIAWTNIFIGSFILFLPPVLLTYTRIRDEANKQIGEFPSLTEIPEIVHSTKYFLEKFTSGLISPREWSQLIDDVKWREENRIHEDFNQWINRTIRFRLIIYIETITMFLVVTFLVYFFLLFIILLSPEMIAEWLDVPLYYKSYKFGLLIPELSLPYTVEPQIKVALMLSVIVAITARVSIMTNDDFKVNALSWLGQKSREWMAASAAYSCLLAPNFQFWKFRVYTPNIFNANIIVPKGLNETDIRKACYKQAEFAGRNASHVIVTAFEKEHNRDDYDFGRAGRRWQLLINRKTDVEQFSDISLELPDEIKYAHNLGFECLERNEQIPNPWFGDEKFAIELSKEIWFFDQGHNLIWHPFVSKIGDSFYVDINLTRRFQKSTDYRRFAIEILKVIACKLTVFTVISLSINFRDSVDAVALVEFFKPADLISYKDEYMRKTKHYRYQNWISM